MDAICNPTPGITSRVVLVDGTIRRPARLNSLAVQALLKHLENKGFEGAPRALGFDENGHEVVSYIEGSAGHYPLKPHVLSEPTLIQLGRLLRRFHDATADLSLPTNVAWHDSISDTAEVICHGDAGPYNTIFREGKPVAFIDFERATPAPRVWDLAFVVYRFTPLCDVPAQVLNPPRLAQIGRRIRILLDAYGFQPKEDLFDWMQLRLKTEIHLFESAKTDDPIRRQAKIEAGHLALYKRDLRLIADICPVLREHVCGK